MADNGSLPVEEADGTGLELLPGRFAAFEVRQARDAMAPQAPVRADERARPGIEGRSAERPSSSGGRAWRRKAAIIASCSGVGTVERGSVGPIGRSATVSRWRHSRTVVGLIPYRRASALALSSLRLAALHGPPQSWWRRREKGWPMARLPKRGQP